MKSLITLIALSLLGNATTAFSASRPAFLQCTQPGARYYFNIEYGKGMTVLSGGWSSKSILEDYPYKLRQGTRTVEKTIALDGMPSETTSTEVDIVQISDAGEKYVLQVERKPYAMGLEGPWYDGILVKSDGLPWKSNEALKCWGDINL